MKSNTQRTPWCKNVCIVVVLLLAIVLPVMMYKISTSERLRGLLPILVRNNNFRMEDVPDLKSKVALVTGGNAGLGFHSAKIMALHGAKVVIMCRSEAKCVEATKLIHKENGGADVHHMVCDLDDLSSVKSFSEAFTTKFGRLDILMLNAGVMGPEFSLSKDGLELQFAVNHVAHHYMTMKLLPLLVAAAPSRIVSVSSSAHFRSVPGGVLLDEEQLNNEQTYSRQTFYGQSKLANLLFAQELAERVIAEGVYVNAIHPGMVSTELGRHYEKYFPAFIVSAVKSIMWSPEEAALTQLYAATSPEIEEKKIYGQFLVPVGDVSDYSEFATKKLRKSVWEFTEKVLEKRGFN